MLNTYSYVLVTLAVAKWLKLWQMINYTGEDAKLSVYRKIRDEIKADLINELPGLVKGLR